jgi:hypothetical protein
MSWMWDFRKATLIPGLIVGIGVPLLYHALFEPLPLRRVRRTKHYHTRRRIDRHHHRANVHQDNDGMYRGRPLHKKKPNSGNYHRVEKKEYLLDRELCRNCRCPPNRLNPDHRTEKMDTEMSHMKKKKGFRKTHWTYICSRISLTLCHSDANMSQSRKYIMITTGGKASRMRR